MNSKKLSICIFLLLGVNLFAQNQLSSGEINYEITMKVDEDKLKKISKKIDEPDNIKKSVVATFKNQGKLHYKLFFNNNQSIFKQDEKLKINEKEVNLIKILVGKGLFYTDKNFGKILNQKEAFGEFFLMNTPKVKWHLSQETKKIGKYVCYKATTEKVVKNQKGKSINKITAWFTPELPISFGPKDYFGLPGLILELKEGLLIYKASEINISFSKSIQIKKPTKGKRITLKEFEELSKKMYESLRSNKE